MAQELAAAGVERCDPGQMYAGLPGFQAPEEAPRAKVRAHERQSGSGLRELDIMSLLIFDERRHQAGPIRVFPATQPAHDSCEGLGRRLLSRAHERQTRGDRQIKVDPCAQSQNSARPIGDGGDLSPKVAVIMGILRRHLHGARSSFDTDRGSLPVISSVHELAVHDEPRNFGAPNTDRPACRYGASNN